MLRELIRKIVRFGVLLATLFIVALLLKLFLRTDALTSFWIKVAIGITFAIALIYDGSVSAKKNTRERRVYWALGLMLGSLSILSAWREYQAEVSAKTPEQLVKEAVDGAKQHTDAKFNDIDSARKIDKADTDKKFEHVEKGFEDMGATLSKSEERVIGKISGTDPDVHAEIRFTFGGTFKSPALRDAVQRVDGKATLAFFVVNVSDIIAKNLDIRVRVCDQCKYAKEPEDFEKLKYRSDLVRVRHFAKDLNPWTSFPVTGFEVVIPDNLQRFPIGFNYSCERCSVTSSDWQVRWLDVVSHAHDDPSVK